MRVRQHAKTMNNSQMLPNYSVSPVNLRYLQTSYVKCEPIVLPDASKSESASIIILPVNIVSNTTIIIQAWRLICLHIIRKPAIFCCVSNKVLCVAANSLVCSSIPGFRLGGSFLKKPSEMSLLHFQNPVQCSKLSISV